MKRVCLFLSAFTRVVIVNGKHFIAKTPPCTGNSGVLSHKMQNQKTKHNTETNKWSWIQSWSMGGGKAKYVVWKAQYAVTITHTPRSAFAFANQNRIMQYRKTSAGIPKRVCAYDLDTMQQYHITAFEKIRKSQAKTKLVKLDWVARAQRIPQRK